MLLYFSNSIKLLWTGVSSPFVQALKYKYMCMFAILKIYIFDMILCTVIEWFLWTLYSVKKLGITVIPLYRYKIKMFFIWQGLKSMLELNFFIVIKCHSIIYMQKCIDYKSQLCFNGHKKLDLILEFTTHNARTFICTVNVHVLHV